MFLTPVCNLDYACSSWGHDVIDLALYRRLKRFRGPIFALRCTYFSAPTRLNATVDRKIVRVKRPTQRDLEFYFLGERQQEDLQESSELGGEFRITCFRHRSRHLPRETCVPVHDSVRTLPRRQGFPQLRELVICDLARPPCHTQNLVHAHRILRH